MKNTQLIIGFVLLFLVNGYSQSNNTDYKSEVDNLKKELTTKDNIIVSQNDKMDKLEKDIEYYKETLNLISSKISTKDNDVTLKINSVVGNSNSGVVNINGILINKGAVRPVQGQKAYATDPQGNGIMSYKLKIGGLSRVDKVLKDVPTKFTIELEQIVEGTPMLASLIIDFYTRSGYNKDKLNVTFKNLNIIWE
ncbi:hypothetical protein [Maribacter sp. 1_MG-2023]|uniref:hypothetical protein n=1 Tax=Maribacter sp. 1_MG-2023 TaxID=3062677 RepID=UPI0026E47DCE|nr:hypothetical protein [Maribacter sp. 1_MG-2023]MDO6473304.1 hypothetical protein [Maribacter sp. 1_MG-2023]